jgi:Tfp pilus assembly protein PilF
VRLAYVLSQRTNPVFAHPAMDAAYHDEWARGLAAGRWIGDDAFYRAPLYPYALGVIYRFVTSDLLGVRLIQAGLGSVTAVLIGRLGARIFSRGTGLLAGIAAALYGMFVYFDAELLTVGVEVLLFTAALLAAEGAGRAGRGFGPAGAALGLAALARPNFLALGPVLALAMPLVGGRARKAALPYAAGFALAVAPAFAYNALVAGEVVPIAWSGGVNFYLGNHEGADGLSALGPRLRPSWWGGYVDAVALAEEEAGRPLARSEVSAYWMRQGLRFIKSNPAGAAVLTGRKLFYFMNGYEVSNNQDIAFVSRHSFLFRGPILLTFSAVMPFAILGFAAAVRGNRRARFLAVAGAAYMMTVLAFFVCARYRLPVMPIVLVFAANGALVLWRLARERRRGSFLAAASLVIVCAVIVRLDPENLRARGPAGGYFALGVAEAAAGDRAAARMWYERAVAANPDHAQSLNSLGVLAAEEGDFAAAEGWYRRALAVEPRSDEILGNLGTLAERRGNLEGAVGFYDQALRLWPHSYRTRANLGLVLLRLGDAARARENLSMAAEHLKTDASVWGNLALACERMGDGAEAARAFREVLRLDPANARAAEGLRRVGGAP